jgi:hypothetical protein
VNSKLHRNKVKQNKYHGVTGVTKYLTISTTQDYILTMQQLLPQTLLVSTIHTSILHDHPQWLTHAHINICLIICVSVT